MDLIEGTYDCIRDQKYVDFIIQMGKHISLCRYAMQVKGVGSVSEHFWDIKNASVIVHAYYYDYFYGFDYD